jgi:hypothetical protein
MNKQLKEREISNFGKFFIGFSHGFTFPFRLIAYIIWFKHAIDYEKWLWSNDK